MKDESNQPKDECEYPAGDSNEHEPTHHAEIVKKLVPINPLAMY